MFDSTQRRIQQSILSVALFAGLALAAISIRLFADGKNYFEQAELAQSSGEPWRKTVMLYENAAKTWFPGNPYPKRALWQLSIIARSAQMRGDVKRATYTWEVIRRSAVSQRHVLQPFEQYVVEAHEHLKAVPSERNSGDSFKNGLSDPAIGWSLLMWVGLLIWIIGASAAILSVKRRRMIYFGASSLCGAGLWILAAALA